MADFEDSGMKADEIFDKGLSLLREDNALSALACFEKAYEMRQAAEFQSYLALCISTERGQIREAIKLCEEAISRDPDNPAHYLNLGRVYLHSKMKQESLTALRSGAGKGTSTIENGEIMELLEKLGARKKPLFPFLPRSNFLNKYLGILLHRLGLR